MERVLPDDIEATVEKWRRLLDLEVDVDVRISDEQTPPQCLAGEVPPRIVLPPDSPEPPIAHEMGHLALAKKYDLCFGQIEFDWRGGEDDFFEDQIEIASSCCDLFVDRIIFDAKPDIVDTYLEYEMPVLTYFHERLEEIPKNESLLRGGLYIVVALITVKLENSGKEISSVMKDILATVERIRSPAEAKTIIRLFDLYKQLPPLPDDRFEAVGLYREATQKTSRILGFRVPYLVLSADKDRHLWSKTNK